MISEANGVQLSIDSRPQPKQGGERYRECSYVFLNVHADTFESTTTGVKGLLELGKQLWRLVNGVYGFVEVETGIPLQDNILRNVIHLNDSTIPSEFREEFRRWQGITSDLDKKVWKAFWGNFLGAEHLRQLGGIKNMQRVDPYRRILPDFGELAYKLGKQRIADRRCHEKLDELTSDGLLVTLSEDPLAWPDLPVQERQVQFQSALDPISIMNRVETSSS